MSEGQPFKLFTKPKLESSSLVVAWNQDVGKVGAGVVDYLNRKLEGREFAEISPEGFFSLGGVSVEEDIAQFPESKFYWCQENSLVIFKSDIPQYEWYRFLGLVLDIAEKYCKVKEIYIVGGMVSAAAHTMPRILLSVVNSTDMKRVLSHHELVSDMDYETQDGQRPTFSSFLLWAAKRRNIAGASLWVTLPFYLLAADLQACKKLAEFFNAHLELSIDLSDIDEEVARQNKEIAQVRSKYPDLDGYISKLEGNLSLTVDESQKLVREMEEWLRKRR
ncbi:MAG: PAC2 family protein [Chloroflexota bacterium]|nr:MAG: PAC2 family protein [Chloroflexota bacterium]